MVFGVLLALLSDGRRGTDGRTVQLRARQFHSTHPGEFDYFSPRNHVQLMPTLQLRRRLGGWRYVAAVGFGARQFTLGATRAF